MRKEILHLENIRFSYDSRDAWDLHTEQLRFGMEHMACLVGPNGSGKSTLLRILAGILRPQTGDVLLAGDNIGRLSRGIIARRVGYLPQETPALFDLTIREVVMLGRYVHGSGWGGVMREDEAAVMCALESVDIVALQYRRLSQVSGGERRRALLASVLAQAPEILLLDEPTSALDIHHAVELMRLLAGFRPPAPAVIVVTHDINLASLFADRLLLLDKGRIVKDGRAETVITSANMRAVYGEGFVVERHPHSQTPMVIPVRVDGPLAALGDEEAMYVK